MITQRIWITWASMAIVRERPLNLFTHSPIGLHISLRRAEFVQEMYIYISRLSYFSTLGWSRKFNSFLVRGKDPFIVHSQYHDCSCHGSFRRQGKNNHDVDNHAIELIRMVYSGLNTKIDIRWLSFSINIITKLFYSAHIKDAAYNVITMSFLVVIRNIMTSAPFPRFNISALTSGWIFVAFEMTC